MSATNMETVTLDDQKPPDDKDQDDNSTTTDNPKPSNNSKPAPQVQVKDDQPQTDNKPQQQQPASKFGLGKIASGISKTFTSTINKASSVTTSIGQTIASHVPLKKNQDDKNNDGTKSPPLYKGDYKSSPDWKPKAIINPGSIARKQKRVLVTGGAGFIGSHLVDSLMERGYDVICVDNLFSGQKTNIYKWFGHPNFEFMRHDVCNPLYVEVDEIYHLACPASPVFYQNNPIKTVKTCFMGTMYMLGLAKRVGARILLTSTSEIYGDPKVHPQVEEYWGNVNNIGVRSCYDEGKRIAETLMMEYYRQHKVNIAIARIFNTYGPRMLENDGRVVSNFIVQALNGKKLTIYGNGSQTRSFCYIDDQINGLIKLMESGEIGPINIGNPVEYSITELAKTVTKLVNIQMNKSDHTGYEYKDLPSDDPKKRKPDITKAKTLLGWNPKINLEKGLGATIEYFIDYMGLKQKNQNNDDNNDDKDDANNTDKISADV